MLIGVPKEIKVHEYRVGLTSGQRGEFTSHGHRVIVGSNAGAGISNSDNDYKAVGAEIAGDAAEVSAKADMIVKVKEPQAPERKMLRPGQILFTYLHLAPDPEQTRDLVESGAICIAYETVTDDQGGLPLVGAHVAGGGAAVYSGRRLLSRACARRQRHSAGRCSRRRAGESGHHRRRRGRRKRDHDGARHGRRRDRARPQVDVLGRLSRQFGPALRTVYSTRAALEEYVIGADMVIGAVLVVGAEAPKLVSAKMVTAMKPGSVLVDVAIDQGGCFETSHPTTHADPTYVVDGIVHYCVANMPGAVPITSTYALNNVTLPYALALADKGYVRALLENPDFRNGLNVCEGKVTYRAVADDLGYEFVDPATLLQGVAPRVVTAA